MKRLSIAFLAFYITNATELDSTSSKVVYQTRIAPANTIVPPVLYKGVILQPQDGYLFFTDTKKNTFTIAVAPIEIPQNNAITRLHVPSGKPYTIYTCQKKIIEKSAETLRYSWEITQENGIGSMSLPEDALIFIANPEHIESLDTMKWQKGAIAIPLPTLHFIQGTQKDSVQACLASIDMRPFHGKQETVIKQEGKTISMQRQTV